MFWSFSYLLFHRVLRLASPRPRSDDYKELEIVVLRHELAAGAGEVISCDRRGVLVPGRPGLDAFKTALASPRPARRR